MCTDIYNLDFSYVYVKSMFEQNIYGVYYVLVLKLLDC